jgi:hypothetical protein
VVTLHVKATYKNCKKDFIASMTFQTRTTQVGTAVGSTTETNVLLSLPAGYPREIHVSVIMQD